MVTNNPNIPPPPPPGPPARQIREGVEIVKTELQDTKLVQTITAFKTTDGIIFESEDEARNHENTAIARAQLEVLLDRIAYYDMSRYDIAEMLLDHKVEFIDILKKL